MPRNRIEHAPEVPEGSFEDEPGHESLFVEQREWREDLTQELVDTLCRAARYGAFKRPIAIVCGVRPELLEWWLDEGMRPDGPELMRQLSARFLSTLESANMELVVLVRHHAQHDHKAAIDFLSRRDPLWNLGSNKERTLERDNAPPETSLSERYRMLVESLKRPVGEMRRALAEAGRMPEDSELQPVDLDLQNESGSSGSES